MALRKYSTPGVYRAQVDQSTLISPAGTSTGGVVIRSKKGPINQPVLVTSDKDFIDIFGTPTFTSGTTTADTATPEMGYGAYAALEFLKESNSLYVVRTFDTDDRFSSLSFVASGVNAATGIVPLDSPTPDTSTKNYTLDLSGAGATSSLLIGAIGPGLDGNNIAVTVETFSSACDWFNSYDTYTSATAAGNHPIAEKVFKIQVFTKLDSETWSNIHYSGISASPKETFYGTRDSQLDSNKTQLKISDIVNGISQYIYVVPGAAEFTAGNSLAHTPSADSDILELSGGALDYGTGIGETDGWSYFSNREDVVVNILICPDYTMSVKQEVARIAATRQDCIAVGQSAAKSVLTSTGVIGAETYGYINPSYMALYGGWDKTYDGYNDKTVYLPKAIYGAALMARTDRVANTWDAPAGIDRGIIASLDQNKRFSFAEIGQLRDANINTSRYIKGIGEVMWAQKTAQLKKSALADINVRRLLLYIENSIEPNLLPFLFAPNNSSTRLRIWSIVDSFLSTVKAGGGLDAYQVVCDDSNNTAAVINNNTCAVDLYVQPTRVIEFIQLTTIITQSGVSFSEISK